MSLVLQGGYSRPWARLLCGGPRGGGENRLAHRVQRWLLGEALLPSCRSHTHFSTRIRRYYPQNWLVLTWDCIRRIYDAKQGNIWTWFNNATRLPNGRSSHNSLTCRTQNIIRQETLPLDEKYQTHLWRALFLPLTHSPLQLFSNCWWRTATSSATSSRSRSTSWSSKATSSSSFWTSATPSSLSLSTVSSLQGLTILFRSGWLLTNKGF